MLLLLLLLLFELLIGAALTTGAGVGELAGVVLRGTVAGVVLGETVAGGGRITPLAGVGGT